MLYHRAGTVFEDMYWIDAESCKIVAQETENDFEEEIRYSETTRKAIRNSSHLITIHSHPGSYPPSLSDLNSNYEHRYILGVIACHDGSVYIYSSEEWISEYYYNVTVAGYLEKGYKAGDLLNFVRNIRIDFRR